MHHLPIYRSSHLPNTPHSIKEARLSCFRQDLDDYISAEIEDVVALALYRRGQLKIRQAKDIDLQLIAIFRKGLDRLRREPGGGMDVRLAMR